MNEPIFYVNGRFVPQNQAFVSVSDIGLLRSYGVFDFTITYNRKPFRLRDHINRLWNSAKIIGLELSWSKDELEELVHKTLEKNPDGEQGIRIVVTGGESPDTFTPSDEPSLVIMVKPVKVYPRDYYMKGVKAITFPGRREVPEAKTLNYVYAIKALKKARSEGAEEAIYAWRGKLFECTVCSFFAVKDDRIITAGSHVLDGITRRTVLELIKEKIPVEYRFVKVSEIPHLDEAFLASSAHSVMPIVTIDQTTIGKGEPGPVTKKVMRMFEEHTGKRLYE